MNDKLKIKSGEVEIPRQETSGGFVETKNVSKTKKIVSFVVPRERKRILEINSLLSGEVEFIQNTSKRG